MGQCANPFCENKTETRLCAICDIIARSASKNPKASIWAVGFGTKCYACAMQTQKEAQRERSDTTSMV
jgi:hypothetical protein